MALSTREARIATEYAQVLKAEEKAKTLYARAHERARKLALKIQGKAVRISEKGKYLIAEDQFSDAIKADKGGEDCTLWAHGAVRRWKLITRNFDE